MTPVQELAEARYVLLTTFRKDGTPVPTPVWVVPLGDALGVWTGHNAGKVKRLRRNAQVTIATCDYQGRNGGQAHAGSAEVVDRLGVEEILRQLRRKYGFQASVTLFGSWVSGRLSKAVGLRVTLDPAE